MKNLKKGLLLIGAVVVLIFLVSNATGSFCLVEVYRAGPPGVWLPMGWTKIKCKDLENGFTRTKITKLLGYCIFWGLLPGRDYKIYVEKYPEFYYNLHVTLFPFDWITIHVS